MTLNFNMRLNWRNFPLWLFLGFFSLIFGILTKFRVFLYLSQRLDSTRVGVPIISIGNLTVGGTGKTPMVGWILEFIKRKGCRPSVLTRGYKFKAGKQIQILRRNQASNPNWIEYGDEPIQLSKQYPDVPIYVSSNRVASAKLAAKHADVLLLDDGMQHLQLNRDLNLVLVDANRGFGNLNFLPLGPLREPLKNLIRSDVVLITRSNQNQNKILKDLIRRHVSLDTPIFESEYICQGLVGSLANSKKLFESIKGKKCALFSGIGNPESFEKVITNGEGKITNHRIFQDHQNYDKFKINELKTWIRKQDAEFVLTTEKDWVKLEDWKSKFPEFYRLEMKVKMPVEFEKFMFDWTTKSIGKSME